MKRQRFFLLAPAAALFVLLAGWFTTSAKAQFSTNPQMPAGDPATILSPPALQLANMASAGASDDGLMAFIANYPSTFNVTAQGIICLQGLGISSSVTLAMMNHDLFLNDNPNALPPISLGSPEIQPQITPPGSSWDESNQYQADGFSPEMDPSLNDLGQYGSWDYLAGSGWCWQPSAWLGYFYYPWGLTQLQNGCWRRHPSRGWLWFPNCNVRGFQNAGVVPHQMNQGQISTGQVNPSQVHSHAPTMTGRPAMAHHGHR